MTFEVGSAINYLTDSILNAPIVFWVSKNPLYTALVVTFLILLITMFVFRDAEGEESVTVMALRSSFWIFLLLVGVLMVHNRVLIQEATAQKRSNDTDSVFSATMGKNLHTEYVPVAPNMQSQQQSQQYQQQSQQYQQQSQQNNL